MTSKQMIWKVFVGVFLLIAASPNVVRAETVSELSRQGKHLLALEKYYQSPDSVVLDDILSAAQSAWALGLGDRARKLWDLALARNDFRGSERSRAVLARSILEFQEGNYETARAYSEKEARNLPESELRAQFWLLIGESLKKQGAVSLAEEYYQKAVNEAQGDTKNEAAHLLGECELRLGKVDEARYSFASVGMNSPYAVETLRRLTEIDLAQRNFEGVLMWTDEGRESFPSQFAVPWVRYARINALLELNRQPEAFKELKEFRVRHAETNPWYIVAHAAFEASALAKNHSGLIGRAEAP